MNHCVRFAFLDRNIKSSITTFIVIPLILTSVIYFLFSEQNVWPACFYFVTMLIILFIAELAACSSGNFFNCALSIFSIFRNIGHFDTTWKITNDGFIYSLKDDETIHIFVNKNGVYLHNNGKFIYVDNVKNTKIDLSKLSHPVFILITFYLKHKLKEDMILADLYGSVSSSVFMNDEDFQKLYRR
ncbi:hypothetical protein Paride_0165 [Pseudomonas phage Paride]|nr:hypothetical protein Paride_0165 [Pseudomonas phage Paride]BDR25689.1 hypothetical protein RVBP16_1290 [Pseudomonas phage sp. 30-2]